MYFKNVHLIQFFTYKKIWEFLEIQEKHLQAVLKLIFVGLLAQNLYFLKHTWDISGNWLDIFGLKQDLKIFLKIGNIPITFSCIMQQIIDSVL